MRRKLARKVDAQVVLRRLERCVYGEVGCGVGLVDAADGQNAAPATGAHARYASLEQFDAGVKVDAALAFQLALADLGKGFALLH